MKHLLRTITLLLLLCSQAIAHLHDSVCSVSCPPYGGSGCLVGVSSNGRGIVLSAAHVTDEGDRSHITVKFPKIGKPIAAKILGEDEAYDLVALDIAAPAGIETPVRVKAATKSDGRIVHVGYPYFAQGKQRYTIGPYIGYAGKGESAWAPDMLHTRCEVVSGYSGGARFNLRGEYVGVISGMTGDSESKMDRAWGASGNALVKFVSRWMKPSKAPQAAPKAPKPTPDAPDHAPSDAPSSFLIELDPEFREVNQDGSCGYIATAYCLKMCGLWKEAEEFRRRNRGGSTDSSIHAALNELGVRHKIGHNGDEKLLQWAVRNGRGAAITWGGAHCICLCGIEDGGEPGFSDDTVVLLGNHQVALKEYKRQPWDEFMQDHRSSGGWSIVILDGAPPKPSDK